MKKILAVLMLAVSAVLFSGAGIAQTAKPDILEVIEISGGIGSHHATAIAAQVEKINESKNIKGVLLVLDTPGGGVIASDQVREELSKLKVPTMVWCQSVCASGGVWIAMNDAVKFIAVRPQTIGGSVGVIAQVTRFNRLLDYLKVDNETYKSGALKDTFNPTRAANDAERAYIQASIDATAAEFYSLISQYRKVPAASWPEIKSARIFVGKEIVAVGLADAVMTKEQAHAKAKELSGSKTIFTREELKKMSKAADESTHMAAPPIPGQYKLSRQEDGWVDHAAFIVETLREIRAGESVRFELRMPYRF